MGKLQHATDPRCVYVDRPLGLPEAVWIGEECLAGPFCARCGHPHWMHRASDNRCLKYANAIPGPTWEYVPRAVRIDELRRKFKFLPIERIEEMADAPHAPPLSARGA